MLPGIIAAAGQEGDPRDFTGLVLAVGVVKLVPGYAGYGARKSDHTEFGFDGDGKLDWGSVTNGDEIDTLYDHSETSDMSVSLGTLPILNTTEEAITGAV